ncbi:MAG: chorismate synthase [Oscillospiraceae bacterium]|jgi:chorismate synthase|nr:chorismate synthase [Oscillospiraceae bacterium]
MPSAWNNRNLHLSIFGESHGGGIGVVLDGIPGGTKIHLPTLRAFMERRAPGRTATSTKRKEDDLPEILSGALPGGEEGILIACGTPIAAVIRNTDTHSADYSRTAALARPGHGDYTGHLRYGGYNDIRGGGHFSARLTAPLVFAGGICKQLLSAQGIEVGAHVLSIGGMEDTPFDPVMVSRLDFETAAARSMPVLDETAGARMAELVERARLEQDSVGGVVEAAIVGMPAGIGDPMFGGIENVVSSLVFGIPAVKGISFGEGFGFGEMRGSQANDPFYMDRGEVRTETNHAGGILGGITSGMPIVIQAAFKPTPSISRPQKTIDYINKTDAVLEIKGRHDPCVIPRAVPCVEAALAIAMASFLV